LKDFSMPITIHSMIPADWPDVAAIYQAGIDTGNATFAIQPPAAWDEWSAGKLACCRLVARDGDKVAAWAALSPVSGRYVYRGVAEVSIYVADSARGQGVGSALLAALITESEAKGIWTLQAGIFPENQASLRLHTRHGFKQLGVHEKIGYMSIGPYQGRWRDVALLERRSTVVGV
jgi:phosphinothricin acetyltransferase